MSCLVWITSYIYHCRQIPVSFGVSLYEAVSLYKGRRVISSKGDEETHWRVHQLVIYCTLGILAGIVGGLLGLGGGFIMGPLFLELGVPPQVTLVFLLKHKRTDINVSEIVMLLVCNFWKVVNTFRVNS